MDTTWVSRFFSGQVLLAVALLAAGIFLLVSNVPPVVLTWETASEVGTAGFNVFRAPVGDSASGEDWVKVNAALIPAEGDEMVGADYAFEDDDVRPGRRYRYQIEEVEWDGTTTRYPEEVVVRAGLSPRWTKLEGGALIVLAAFFVWRRMRAL